MHKGWLLLLVPCLLLVYLLDEPTRPPEGSQQNVPAAGAEVDFDSWSADITTTLFNAEGKVSYTMQAARQMHFLDDTTALEQPLLSFHQDSGERWNVVADSGRIHHAKAERGASTTAIDYIDLFNNVELHQIDEFGNWMTLTTSMLRLDSDPEMLSTDRSVLLRTSTLEQTAVGMEADLALDSVTFLSQVRGRYDENRPR